MRTYRILLPILCVTATSCTTEPGEYALLPRDGGERLAADLAPAISAEELAARMVDAYRSAPVHEETQVWTYEPVAVEGGMLTRPSRSTVEVMMDRKYHRLRMRIVQEYDEMPEENVESLLVATDSRLWYKSSAYPGRHLEVDLPELSYSAVTDPLPILRDAKSLAILSLLLADDPLRVICDGQTPNLKTIATDQPGQLKLVVESEQRNLILCLAPDTSLITDARLEETLPSGVGGSHHAVSNYKATAERSSEPPDGAIEFHAGVSKAVGSFQEFVMPVQ